jgi:hypothetical protein
LGSGGGQKCSISSFVFFLFFLLIPDKMDLPVLDEQNNSVGVASQRRDRGFELLRAHASI